MKVLALCYPTFGRVLHLDSKGTSVIVATDELLKIMIERGVEVTVINLSSFQTPLPLLRSRLPLLNPNTICQDMNFDVCWHMFRDPTQPEVLDRLKQIPVIQATRFINTGSKLVNHYKHHYIPILHRFGIGPKLVAIDPKTIHWGKDEWSTAVSEDRTLILCYNFNNNRGDYPERERFSKVVVEYVDAAINGRRSFFRVGYALGKTLPGWMYTTDDSIVIQKSGSSKDKVPHEIPDQFHATIANAMDAIGVDVCHLEGTYLNGELRIFDINPYPTSNGNTLSDISKVICDVVMS